MTSGASAAAVNANAALMRCPEDLILDIHAFGVDLWEDVHAVPGPVGDLRRRDTGVNQSDTAAWRRSYGRLASGEAYSA